MTSRHSRYTNISQTNTATSTSLIHCFWYNHAFYWIPRCTEVRIERTLIKSIGQRVNNELQTTLCIMFPFPMPFHSSISTLHDTRGFLKQNYLWNERMFNGTIFFFLDSARQFFVPRQSSVVSIPSCTTHPSSLKSPTVKQYHQPCLPVIDLFFSWNAWN